MRFWLHYKKISYLVGAFICASGYTLHPYRESFLMDGEF